MKASEFREMDLPELQHQESEARERMFRLRFQISMGQTDGVKKYRATKKDLARIMTAMGEKAAKAEDN